MSATNVSQFAQPKKHHGQQCVLVYHGLKTILLEKIAKCKLKVVQMFTIRLAKVLLTCQVPIYNLNLINKQWKQMTHSNTNPSLGVMSLAFTSLFQILNLWGWLKGEGMKSREIVERMQPLLLLFVLLPKSRRPISTCSLQQLSNYSPNVCSRLEFIEAPENINALSALSLPTP